MILEDIGKKLQKIELLSKLNSISIVNKKGEKKILLKVNEEDIEYVDESISKSEYLIDKVGFLQKVLQKIPLLKAGSENKEKLTEEDFIQYV